LFESLADLKIARNIRRKLRTPELFTGFRHACVLTSMAMPETAMDKDDASLAAKNEIWSTCDINGM
jgi:hypothetical protein